MTAASSSSNYLHQNAEFDTNFTKAWDTEFKQPMYSIEHYIVKWSIENMSLVKEKEHKDILSPVFILDCSKTELLLSFNPNIFRNGQKCFLFCIRRYNEVGGLDSVGITFRFGVSKADNSTFWFDERKDYDFRKNATAECLISGTEQLEILTKGTDSENNTFVVNCEIYICYQIFKTKLPLTVADYDFVNLSYDFTKLIHAKEASDYCIKIPRWDIITHKAILIARSSYFKTIILEDQESKHVTLSDVSYNNITSLLTFMYSANFNLVAKNGPPDIGFYECAQRFNVAELVKLLTPKELHVKTILKTVELEIAWHIENFSKHLTDTNNSIISPPFKIGNADGPQWTFTINTICSSAARLNCDSIDIFANVDRESDVLLSIMKLSLLDKKGILQNTKTATQLHAAGGFEFPNFLTQFPVYNKIHGFLQNDTLKMHCRLIHVFSSGVFVSHDLFHSNYTPISLFKDLSQNLRNILESSLLCDITLKSNITFIEAHRSILYARSRTLGTKFLCKTLEDNILEVGDIDPDILPHIIMHAYTGVFSEISTEYMVPLLSVAHKYCFRSLTMVCAELVGQKIDHLNFYELVKLGSKLQSISLLHNCAIFARKNAKQIIRSPQFQKLKKEEKGAHDFIFARILAVLRRK